MVQYRCTVSIKGEQQAVRILLNDYIASGLSDF